MFFSYGSFWGRSLEAARAKQGRRSGLRCRCICPKVAWQSHHRVRIRSRAEFGSIRGLPGAAEGRPGRHREGPGNPKSARNVTNIVVSAKSLGSIRAVPRETPEGSCGSLGKPWDVSGASWVVTGGSLGRPWGISGAPWEVPEGPWGVPGVFQGASGAPLGQPSRFTNSLKNQWVL